MTDVNEELVKVYFEFQGYFTVSNREYPIVKGSTGYGDIDLLIFHPKTKDRAAVQVKGWHTTVFTTGKIKRNEKQLLDSLLTSEAQTCARGFFGTDNYRKVLVISKFSPIEERKKEAQEYLRSKKVEWLLFSDVFKHLVEDLNSNYYHNNSEILYTIAKLKMYGFLKEEND